MNPAAAPITAGAGADEVGAYGKVDQSPADQSAWEGHKNDFNDAEAIFEAVTRANMRFVAVKTVEQQDLQGLHRIRQSLVASRTALVNCRFGDC